MAAALGAAFTSLLAPACFTATSVEPGGPDLDASGLGDTERLDGYPVHPQAPCLVTIDAPPRLSRDHVSIGTSVQYDSNPASSGPHYPIWAAYQEYTEPVDPRYYVHDEEHGAIILLYNCPGSSDCTSVVAGLERVVASIPPDPACVGNGVSVRYVLAPDLTIPAPIASDQERVKSTVPIRIRVGRGSWTRNSAKLFTNAGSAKKTRMITTPVATTRITAG